MAYKTQPFLLLRTSSYVTQITQITQIGLCGNGAQTSKQAGSMHAPLKRKLYCYNSDTDRRMDSIDSWIYSTPKLWVLKTIHRQKSRWSNVF